MKIVSMILALMLEHMYGASACGQNPRSSAGDPEAHMTVEEVVKYQGYPIETYDVVTDDGYILTLHRIPHGIRDTTPGKKVIIITHGILANSGFWLAELPIKNLPYLLADRGYDVFLSNLRGNNYARRHKTLSPDSPAFWNFTFNEIGNHDLPAIFNRVLEVSGQKKFTYIGHSMGTTAMFIFLSRNPNYDKVKSFHALAPLAQIHHAKSPLLQLLIMIADPGITFLEMFKQNEFLPNATVWDVLADTVCKFVLTDHIICSNVLFFIMGFDSEQFNDTRLPVYLNFVPAGTSSKNMRHYAQIAQAKKFQEFDYGKSGNQIMYKQDTPPLYDVTKITTDVYMYSGPGDWVVDLRDVKWLEENLKTIVKNYVVNYTKFNHVDFAWAIDVIPLLYDELLADVDESS